MMKKNNKQIISFILFGLAVLSFASGFLILMLVMEVWYGAVAMFVFGMACLIVGLILYPKGTKPMEEVKPEPKPNKVESPHFSSSYDPVLEELENEEEEDEEENLRKKEQELEDEWDEDEFYEELDDDK